MLHFKTIFFNHSTTIFQKKAMADLTPIFLLEETEEPMATKPIYVSSDESEYAFPNTAPDHHHESIYPDSIYQLIASQLEQRSYMGTETLFYPPTPNTSITSDDDKQMNLTPIIRNPEQKTSQIPERHNQPIQLCQYVKPNPDTPESPPPEHQGPRNICRPYDLHNPSTSASFNKPPKISTKADGLQKLTLHPHPQRNEWVTGCLICRKSYN